MFGALVLYYLIAEALEILRVFMKRPDGAVKRTTTSGSAFIMEIVSHVINKELCFINCGKATWHRLTRSLNNTY